MALPVVIAAAAAAVGTGLKIYGEVSAADARSAAARAQAEVNRRTADEIGRRGEINAAVVKREGDLFLASQAAGYASAGVEASTGSALIDQVFTANEIRKQVWQVESDARFRQRSALMGADALDQQASQFQTAGVLGGVAAGVDFAGYVGGEIYGRNWGSDQKSPKKDVI